jgi:hypothetical protein
MSKRWPVETTIVSIDVFAEVQDNGDGTWSAWIPYAGQRTVTASTREEALEKAAKSASVKIGHPTK